ncbi:MAG: hypothetical protein JO021_11510 [Alphaproteobacteria bacterium]|nr:hypothetical protein [Alphaproteobacteria bacterium]
MIRIDPMAARNKLEALDPEGAGMRRLLARLVQGEPLGWKEVLAVAPESKKSIQLYGAMPEREPCDAVAA